MLLQVAAAEAKGKAVVLVNPVLKDIPSHSGIMGVRCNCKIIMSSSYRIKF